MGLAKINPIKNSNKLLRRSRTRRTLNFWESSLPISKHSIIFTIRVVWIRGQYAKYQPSSKEIGGYKDYPSLDFLT
jgi:hypothetical protein